MFSTDNITFLESGDVKITFHGIKDDMSCSLQLNTNQTLCDYLHRTQDLRPADNPVFLTLAPPYKAIAITAATVAKIMNEAISLAGLTGLQSSVDFFL